MDVQYVNAYAVDRVYGGPEEGGWWYDAGEPLASIPARTEEEIEEAKTRLREIYAEDYADNPGGRQGRYSVIGGSDLEIYVEDEIAKPFPATTPHYE